MDNTNKLAKKNNNGTVGQATLKSMINDERTKNKFKEMLGNKAAGFLTSLMNTTNGNAQLQQADPNSILKAGAIAATLDLPIDPNLGFAYIVPYNNKGKNEAQFQMGYKGFVQLAIRTGQYKRINVTELYEGQFESYDPITDELKYNLDNRLSDEITHYVAYFQTINGFEKYNVMSKEEIETHAKKFSKTYSYKGSSWQTNFNTMAKKTVLKLLLSKFGILSIEMQTAQKADQAVIREFDKNNIEVEYVDNENNVNDTTDDIVINESDTANENNSDDEDLKEMFNSEDQF
jgi:recombinase, phage recT family|nr:MAG TPA: RecT protein [Caudoviricetes sp.]